MLDNELPALQGDMYQTALAYCRGADLIVSDAAYLARDYPQKRGWGHSTVQDGVKLAEASGCKRMVFSHYGFEYTDRDLDELQKSLGLDGNRFLFARDGMEIAL
jgi:ribonuclease BN (tRNA processing enzyme)